MNVTRRNLLGGRADRADLPVGERPAGRQDCPHNLVGMNQRLETAVQLIAIAAFIAAILIIVTTSLTLISDQCTRGTPFLPAIFPCFARQ
jgi:hypothetical protein